MQGLCSYHSGNYHHGMLTHIYDLMKGTNNFAPEELLLLRVLKEAWKPVNEILLSTYDKQIQDKGSGEIKNSNASTILTSSMIQIISGQAGDFVRENAREPLRLAYQKREKISNGTERISKKINATILEEVQSLLSAMIGIRFSEQYMLIAEDIDRLLNEIINKEDIRAADLLSLRGRVEKMFTQDSWLTAVSSVQTSRAFQYGSLDYYQEKLIEKYLIDEISDERTCSICNALDGKVFTIESAVEKRNRFLEAGGTDDAAKSIYPFPGIDDVDNKSPEYWQNTTFMPPFHPRCRGQIIALS